VSRKFIQAELPFLEGLRRKHKLSGLACWALFLFWYRHRKAIDKKTGELLYNNNGQITCTKRDVVEWCGCGDHKALAILTELQKAGLITCTKKGEHHVYATGAYGTPSKWKLNFV
jgi:hypothetical protein